MEFPPYIASGECLEKNKKGRRGEVGGLWWVEVKKE